MVRTPAPVEFGSLSHYLRWVLYIQPVVGLGISSCHQQYHVPMMQVFEPVAPEELVRSQDPVCVLGDEIFVGKFPSPPKEGLVYREFQWNFTRNPGWFRKSRLVNWLQFMEFLCFFSVSSRLTTCFDRTPPIRRVDRWIFSFWFVVLCQFKEVLINVYQKSLYGIAMLVFRICSTYILHVYRPLELSPVLQ